MDSFDKQISGDSAETGNLYFEEEYLALARKYGHVVNNDSFIDEQKNIKGIIKDTLDSFLNCHNNVAIYCFGEHTRFLLAEFIYELRNIKYIIDNGCVINDSGYIIISDKEIEDYGIDGVIISTYQFCDEIRNVMKEKHSDIDYIDFYEVFENVGVKIEGPFYRVDSPFSRYEMINYCRLNQDKNLIFYNKKLLENYIAIKDFKLVYETAEKLYGLTKESIYLEMHDDFQKLYYSFYEHLGRLQDVVLLLCMDAMRSASIKGLKKTYPLLQKKGKEFTCFYSYSTSTFESLYPVFTENTDQQTGYYDNNAIEEEKCRFTRMAIDQGRGIYVIGDGFAYFKGQHIYSDENWTTLTQKLYTFLVLAEKDPSGLFWVQPPYESHVSFISPYCEETILIKPANVFLEYKSDNDILDKRYFTQYELSIKYIDDTLYEFVKNVSCRMLFFSDHGDHDFEAFSQKKAKDIKDISFTAAEENIKIPFILISPDENAGESVNQLHSLLELNDVVCSMLSKKQWKYLEKKYIKIGRTAIYNPELIRVIKKVFKKESSAKAFEGFVFDDGYKLLVFSDGEMKLYKIPEDEEVLDKELILMYYKYIVGELSVYKSEQ